MMLNNTATSDTTSYSSVREAHQTGGRRNRAGLRAQQVPTRSVARFHTQYTTSIGASRGRYSVPHVAVQKISAHERSAEKGVTLAERLRGDSGLHLDESSRSAKGGVAP